MVRIDKEVLLKKKIWALPLICTINHPLGQSMTEHLFSRNTGKSLPVTYSDIMDNHFTYLNIMIMELITR